MNVFDLGDYYVFMKGNDVWEKTADMALIVSNFNRCLFGYHAVGNLTSTTLTFHLSYI